MHRNADLIVYTAALIAFAAVVYADWRLGSLLGCGTFRTPDTNILASKDAYSSFWKCLSANNGVGAGRFIAIHTLRLDMIFPPLLTLAVTLALFRIASGLPRFVRLPVYARWLAMALLPVLYLGADYAENLAVMNWLKSGDSAVPSLIPAMTAAKFAALGVTLVLAIALKLAALRHRGNL